MITWGNPWSLRWTRFDGNLSVQTGASIADHMDHQHDQPARPARALPHWLSTPVTWPRRREASGRRTVKMRGGSRQVNCRSPERSCSSTVETNGRFGRMELLGSPGAGGADERVHSIPVEWPEFPVTTGQLPDRTAWTDPQLVVRSGRHLAHSSPWI